LGYARRAFPRAAYPSRRILIAVNTREIATASSIAAFRRLEAKTQVFTTVFPIIFAIV